MLHPRHEEASLDSFTLKVEARSLWPMIAAIALIVPRGGMAAEPAGLIGTASAVDVVANATNSVVSIKVKFAPLGSFGHRNFELSEASGSGVVVAQGIVVTSWHVVAPDTGDEFEALRNVITVRIGDQELLAYVLIYSSDRSRDIAFLDLVGTPPNTHLARIGASDALRAGERVFAIGSPLGLEHTVSDGIVSGRRPAEMILNTVPLDKRRLIQTSAAISAGSSGGGLFNAAGELVGLTFSTAKDGQNLNFAIPSEWIAFRLQGAVDEARLKEQISLTEDLKHILRVAPETNKQLCPSEAIFEWVDGSPSRLRILDALSAEERSVLARCRPARLAPARERSGKAAGPR